MFILQCFWSSGSSIHSREEPSPLLTNQSPPERSTLMVWEWLMQSLWLRGESWFKVFVLIKNTFNALFKTVFLDRLRQRSSQNSEFSKCSQKKDHSPVLTPLILILCTTCFNSNSPSFSHPLSFLFRSTQAPERCDMSPVQQELRHHQLGRRHGQTVGPENGRVHP